MHVTGKRWHEKFWAWYYFKYTVFAEYNTTLRLIKSLSSL